MNKGTKRLKQAKPPNVSLKLFARDMANGSSALAGPAQDWLERKAHPPKTEITNKYRLGGGGKNDPRPRPGRRRGFSFKRDDKDKK